MKISILGTGIVGQTLAARFVELDHDVTIGTRDPQATLARTESGRIGNPSFHDWAAANPAVGLAPFNKSVGDADLVVNAIVGHATIEALDLVGATQLSGKVLIDLSNALDFTNGWPPRLFVDGDDSIAERIQARFPDTKVVKTLNNIEAAVMAHPETLSEATSVFVSGNDDSAKQMVTAFLGELGHTDVIDLGDITSARASEQVFLLWTRLYGALGKPFNLRVVR